MPVTDAVSARVVAATPGCRGDLHRQLVARPAAHASADVEQLSLDTMLRPFTLFARAVDLRVTADLERGLRQRGGTRSPPRWGRRRSAATSRTGRARGSSRSMTTPRTSAPPGRDRQSRSSSPPALRVSSSGVRGRPRCRGPSRGKAYLAAGSACSSSLAADGLYAAGVVPPHPRPVSASSSRRAYRSGRWPLFPFIVHLPVSSRPLPLFFSISSLSRPLLLLSAAASRPCGARVPGCRQSGIGRRGPSVAFGRRGSSGGLLRLDCPRADPLERRGRAAAPEGPPTEGQPELCNTTGSQSIRGDQKKTKGRAGGMLGVQHQRPHRRLVSAPPPGRSARNDSASPGRAEAWHSPGTGLPAIIRPPPWVKSERAARRAGPVTRFDARARRPCSRKRPSGRCS